jgi:hypothetical protein
MCGKAVRGEIYYEGRQYENLQSERIPQHDYNFKMP